MTQYPRDEFDDIDEMTARRGAYRGSQADTHTSHRGLIAKIVAGLLSLLVGGFMYVASPRLSSPEAAAEANASASASASATETEPSTDPSSVTVEVYNSSAVPGAAAVATEQIEAKGYTVSSTGNWAGAYAAESSVNFATGASSEASEIADTLGLPYIAQDYEAPEGQIYVVLGADFDPAAFETQPAEPSAAASAEPSASPSTAEAGQQLFTLDPATGTYVEATEETAQGQTLYTYDPDTGSYVEYSSQDGGTDSQTETGQPTFFYDPATGSYVEDPAGTYIYDAATGTYVQR